MKIRNKILAGLLVAVLALGTLGLPIFSLAKVFAASSNEISLVEGSLQIKNVNKSYDVSNNNFLTITDYCESFKDVTLYTPDGKSVIKTTKAGTSVEGFYFTQPGLHALRFRALDQGKNLYIYSDTIYIPVASSESVSITLDGKLNSSVLPGTVVDVPMAITGDWEEDKSVNVKVFTAYGEVVEATKSSVTNRWSFTNKAGVLGTYYVEYSKDDVTTGKSTQTVYKYETIRFTDNATSAVSTTHFEKPKQEGSNEEVLKSQIVIAPTGLLADEGKIYLYKYYDLSKAYVANADGSTSSAEIYLSIRDVETGNYYDFTNKTFYDGGTPITDPSDARVKVLASTLDKFSLSTDNHLSSYSSDGHNLTFIFSTDAEGIANYEKTLTERMCDLKDVISVELSKPVQSEIIISNITKDTDNKIVFDSDITLNYADGYDKAGISALFYDVIAQVTPKSASAIVSTEAKKDKDIGYFTTVTEGVGDLNTDFEFNYKKITDETSWTFLYNIRFGKKEGNTTKITGITETSYIYIVKESSDKTAPTNLKISENVTISTNGSYTVPKATATDKNDLGSVVADNAKITIKLFKDGVELVQYGTITQGKTLTDLSSGVYALEYTAIDYHGNKRIKTIHFKVERGELVSTPEINNLTGVTLDTQDGETTVNVNGSCNSVSIYIDGGLQANATSVQVSPSSIEYVNGYIKSFKFDYDGTQTCLFVFSSSNDFGTTYKAVNVKGTANDASTGVGIPKIREIGFSKLSNATIVATPNISTDVNVFDRVLWFGSNTFSLEAPENALYSIKNQNEFIFYTAGTYTIKSIEVRHLGGQVQQVNATTTIVVKNGMGTLETTDFIGRRLVAKTGDAIELRLPNATNYYGYTLYWAIKNSAGKTLVSGDSLFDNVNIELNGCYQYSDRAKFIAPTNDEYTFEYTFFGEGFNKKVISETVATGNSSRPVITLGAENTNRVWEGETIRYEIMGATAVDKNNKSVGVNITCYDSYGQALKIINEEGKTYVDLQGAGFYTVYYTAKDSEGLMTVVTSMFAVEFPEEEEEGMSAWAIVGIVLGSIAGAGAIAGIVFLAIRYTKKKNRFINKAKQTKKKEKKEIKETTTVYTVAETKDEKHWVVKNGNKTIAKMNSKSDAIEKAKEVHKKGELSIKVYNKNGRLIDSI